ncbi:MAG TPA: gluconate 2-dehydrogenase subunit 3 family protein [Gemmatimonadaceae bacterium]|nr:gluconate 2-dehydrogenase subunit 3 family protein [Gemmatimonadaceae bacterium]
MAPMNRREALKTGGVALGCALLLSSGILAGCERSASRTSNGRLSRDDEELAAEIADTILPKTASSPGAKEAGAGPAINLLVSDCYEPPAQQRLVKGLDELRQRCETVYQTSFARLSRDQRENMLRVFSVEGKKAPPDTHWFPLMRELAERAYFSSQVGMTQALRYIQVPGKWVGCTPLTPGQPAWG